MVELPDPDAGMNSSCVAAPTGHRGHCLTACARSTRASNRVSWDFPLRRPKADLAGGDRVAVSPIQNKSSSYGFPPKEVRGGCRRRRRRCRSRELNPRACGRPCPATPSEATLAPPSSFRRRRTCGSPRRTCAPPRPACGGSKTSSGRRSGARTGRPRRGPRRRRRRGSDGRRGSSLAAGRCSGRVRGPAAASDRSPPCRTWWAWSAPSRVGARWPAASPCRAEGGSECVEGGGRGGGGALRRAATQPLSARGGGRLSPTGARAPPWRRPAC